MLKLLPKFSIAIVPPGWAFCVSAITTAALTTAVIATSQAQNSTVSYDFTINVTKGSLAGKSFNGSFSYDNSTLKGIGIEELGVTQGLKTCFNYLGRNYSESNDRDYPTFPKLVFENGKIKQLDFWVQPEKRVVWWNLPGWEVKYSQRQASAPTVQDCQKR
ncbi:hypothetical protein IQ274_28735 [Nostoc sp. LEGE 12447]|uniref:hypothetical protein n=1 Tax=Nostoc sp. LEGE 12447 TaxID=1828640 RepID=UPI0018844BFE|nr:hypothetical protein [Nostoc sp. LEGE 12447]MBE9002081.1 hypothetical protein [Nostoc sp. LEGE 12447]